MIRGDRNSKKKGRLRLLELNDQKRQGRRIEGKNKTGVASIRGGKKANRRMKRGACD